MEGGRTRTRDPELRRAEMMLMMMQHADGEVASLIVDVHERATVKTFMLPSLWGFQCVLRLLLFVCVLQRVRKT